MRQETRPWLAVALGFVSAASLALAAGDFARATTRSSVALTATARTEGIAFAIVGAVLVVGVVWLADAARRIAGMFACATYFGLDFILGLTPLGAASIWAGVAALLAVAAGVSALMRSRALTRGVMAAAIGVGVGVLALFAVTAVLVMLFGSPT